MNEEVNNQAPYITIDGVNISIEDLPDEAKGIFGRLQRLNQKKANTVLDLGELQAGINFFSNRIVDIVNEGEEPNSDTTESDTEESDTEEDDSE